MHKLRWVIHIMLSVAACEVAADVYKYKDADGKWHFSDAAPKDIATPDVITVEKNQNDTRKNSAESGDLQEELTNKTQPGTPIETATLAVVKIETPYGTGSAFFVSDSGYLITNKHVVRPASAQMGKTVEDDLKKDDDALKRARDDLDTQSQQIDSYQVDLDNYRKRMNDAYGDNKTKMQQQYDYYSNRFDQMVDAYNNNKKIYDVMKSKLEAKHRAVSEARAANQFKITFKDNSTKEAKLVDLGKKEDLALLKIVGNYKTPYLAVASAHESTQGAEVYSIGSPLGFKDMVNHGFVTHIDNVHIYMDVKILPGNSGGPLISPAGNVLGINTAIYTENGKLESELFSMAIPISAAEEEFSSYWTPVAASTP